MYVCMCKHSTKSPNCDWQAFACLQAHTHTHTSIWMHIRERMKVCMHVSMYASTILHPTLYPWMYVCMYTCRVHAVETPFNSLCMCLCIHVCMHVCRVHTVDTPSNSTTNSLNCLWKRFPIMPLKTTQVENTYTCARMYVCVYLLYTYTCGTLLEPIPIMQLKTTR